MWISIIIFFAFVAIFTIGFRYTLVFATRVVARNIEKTHKTTESILNTKLPPKEWIEKWTRKIERLGNSPSNSAIKDKLRLQAKEYSLKRLASLINYYENSNLVEDEETRLIILEELKEIGRFWDREWNSKIQL